MDRQPLISESKRRHENGEGIESILKFLRASECSKIDCIAIIMAAFGIGLGEAKEAVHLNSVWSDARNRDDQFHELLEDVFKATFPDDRSIS